jgi:hypothetical protein
LTWALVMLSSFLLLAHAGNFEALDQWRRHLRQFYSPGQQWCMLALIFAAALILTFRCLVSGFAAGLSGRKGWYVFSNLLTGVLCVSLIVLVIWRSDRADHPVHLYDLWGWIVWLPALLSAAIVIKMLVALWAWTQVHRRRMLAPKFILGCFVRWALGTASLMALAWTAFPNTPWLRSVLMLLALGLVPLAGPGVAILSLARNRHDPGVPKRKDARTQ